VNWLQFGVQWLHVLLGVLWFGYNLSMAFLVAPPLNSLPDDQLREIYRRLGQVGARVFPIVGALVVLLGIIRGTFLGPIKSVSDAFTTSYGITWLVALVTTLALFYTGARYVGPGFAALSDAPDFRAAGARLQVFTRIDLGLFFVIFTCMILMRFGL
jgi:putative copper export protein